jgi:hypothetical protein
MDNSIIPECCIDTNLIATIVPPRTRYNHTKGCFSVAKKMQEKFADEFALGIIDRDKESVRYELEFVMIGEFSEQLQILKHREKPHYLIYIIPAMEKWIVKCAADVKVNLSDYGIIYENIKELKKITKTVTSDKDDRFRRLFKELKKKNSPAVIKLSKWIEYLRAENYNVNIDKLKQL